MPRSVYKNASNLILLLTPLDNDGNPITGLTASSANLNIYWKASGNSTWQEITLVEGTPGSWVSGGFVELDDGEYELGLPNAAVVPDDRTTVRFIYGTNDPSYDAVDAIFVNFDPPTNFGILSINGTGAVKTQPNPLQFQIGIPGSTAIVQTGEPIYVREKNRTLEFTADEDIENVPLKLILELPDRTDVHIFEDTDLTKVGTKVTVTLPEALVQDEITYAWGIRHDTDLTVYGFGSFSITYAPHEDDEV